MVKIAIIGVGNIAETHINAYLKNPNAELYAFCDINEKRLKQVHRYPNPPKSSKIAALLRCRS